VSLSLGGKKLCLKEEYISLVAISFQLVWKELLKKEAARGWALHRLR
jgi:hypothetical protein